MFDMNLAFPGGTKHEQHVKRTYDAKITINKAGRKKTRIRIALINTGAELCEEKNYVEVSDVCYTKPRLYFRFHEQKQHNMMFRLCRHKQNGTCSFSFTPSEKAEKIMRSCFAGKTYTIQQDADNGEWYIETRKE